MRKCLLLINLLCLAVTQSNAQKHQWAETLVSANEISSAILAVDSSGNSYIGGTFKDNVLTSGVNHIASTNKIHSYLAKYNSAGSIIWLKKFHCTGNAFSDRLNSLAGIGFSINGNVIIAGNYSGSALYMDADNILNINGQIGFLAEIDTAGNPVKCRRVTDRNSIKYMKIDREGNIFFTGITTHTFDYNGQTSFFHSGNDYGVFKYSANLDTFKWGNILPAAANSSMFSPRAFSVGRDGRLYLSATFYGGNFTLANKVYSLPSVSNIFSLIIAFDGNTGALVYSDLLNKNINQKLEICAIEAIDTNQMYVFGITRDSMLIGNSTYRPPSSGSGVGNLFVLALNDKDNVRWIKFSEQKSAQFAAAVLLMPPFNKLKTGSDGSLYVSSLFYGDSLTIGGLSATKPSGWSWLAKFDTLGNALWLRLSSLFIGDFDIDHDNNLIYSGDMVAPEFIYPYTLSSYPYSNKKYTYIAKTTDYTITRGEVFPGPYCAGDTILIPYTKEGEYDTSNYFVAEISDEEGTFEGAERELGRIKSNVADSVKGVLPLWQVASSGKYRIRIRSTAPVVQSFYKVDTLKLLIYSRDSAYAGVDETICQGDTFTLNTYGGTRWAWSPDINMNDSALRKPKVWPYENTTYRIIISDSSGCGDTDTAYKTIFVRDSLRIEPSFSDSVVCNTQDLELKVSLKGGDTSGYRVAWFRKNGTSYDLVKQGKINAFTDTLGLDVNDLDTAWTTYIAVLDDSCSAIKDTTFIRVKTFYKLQLTMPFNDTTLCINAGVNIIPKASGGIGIYQLKWKDLNNSTEMIGDSLLISISDQTANYRVSLADGCMAQMDSQNFYVFRFAELRADIGNSTLPFEDTVLCLGNELEMDNIYGTFPLNPGVESRWHINDSLFSTDTFTILTARGIYEQFGQGSDLAVNIRYELKDQCGTIVDSVLINIPAPLNVNFVSDSFNCPGTTAMFESPGKGGIMADHSFTWFWFDNGIWEEISTDPDLESDTLSFITPIISPQGNEEKFRVVLKDGCTTDSAFSDFTLTYYKPLDLEFTPKDTLICNATNAIISAKASEGSLMNYQLRWLDMNNNQLDTGFEFTISAQHSGTANLPETFSIKAILTDGCMPDEKTAVFSWTVNPPLQAVILDNINEVTDATLCYGQTISLTSSGAGGMGTGYQYQWKLNESDYSQSENILIESTKLYDSLIALGQNTATIRLVLGDNCTGENDSVELQLNLLDPLKVTLFAVDTLCYGNDHFFQANYEGGINNYDFQWVLNGSNVSTDSIYEFIHSGEKGSNEVKVLLTDNCSSPQAADSLVFEIREPLTVKLSADKLCADPEALITATPGGGKTDDHTLIWLDEDDLEIGSGNSLILTPDKATKVFVNLTDNCSKADARDSIVIYPQPQISITLNDTAACEPLELELNIDKITQTENLYSLFSGNSFLDSFRTNTYTATLTKGSFVYRIEVESEGPCKNSIALNNIEVYPIPVADFTWNPLKPNWDDKEINLVNLSKGGFRYEWDIENTGIVSGFQPTIPVIDSGSYFIILKTISEYECEDTIGKTLRILPTLTLYIPNAFTPNGDGFNNYFTIEGSGFKSYNIHILNRWGQTIFTGNQAHHWDGNFEGKPVPDGAYTYIIQLVDNDNNLKMYSGMVTVLR